MSARSLLLIAVFAVVVALVGDRFRLMYDDHRVLQPFDYLEYWSAGRAMLSGQNPYDGGVLWPLQQDITAWDDPIMMWNPPWVLPVAMAVGLTHWRTGQLAWFIFNLGAVLASAFMLWRMFGGSRRLTGLAVGVSLFFAPTIFLLLLGQITGFMLLGLVGFIWFLRSERYLLAGCMAALTSIKPHLLAAFALVLLLESIRHRRIAKGTLVGGAVILVCALLPLLWNPDVWRQYLDASSAKTATTHHTLSDWEHATLGYTLRNALPGRPFAVMFVPLAIAMPLVGAYWWVRRRDWNWIAEMPRLVIVSLLAAPYGAWGNDLVLLLVPVVQATVWVAADRRAWVWVMFSSAFVVLNLALLSTLSREHSMCNPWTVPVTTAGYILVGWCTRTAPSGVRTTNNARLHLAAN